MKTEIIEKYRFFAIVVALIFTILIGGYFLNRYITKRNNAKFIFSRGMHQDLKQLSKMDYDLLRVWKSAIISEKSVFEYKGAKYKSLGGTILK